jgi:short/branched chain acyl-CoA dehydrogenase
MGVSVPTQYGGSGMSFTSSVIVIDELARVDPAVSVMVDVQNTLVNNLVERFGSEYIRETCLPRLTKDTLGSFCLSESSSGSDAFALKARAVRARACAFRTRVHARAPLPPPSLRIRSR